MGVRMAMTCLPFWRGVVIKASVEKEMLGHMPWGRWDPQTLRGQSEKSLKVVRQTSLVKQGGIKISDRSLASVSLAGFTCDLSGGHSTGGIE